MEPSHGYVDNLDINLPGHTTEIASNLSEKGVESTSEKDILTQNINTLVSQTMTPLIDKTPEVTNNEAVMNNANYDEYYYNKVDIFKENSNSIESSSYTPDNYGIKLSTGYISTFSNTMKNMFVNESEMADTIGTNSVDLTTDSNRPYFEHDVTSAEILQDNDVVFNGNNNKTTIVDTGTDQTEGYFDVSGRLDYFNNVTNTINQSTVSPEIFNHDESNAEFINPSPEWISAKQQWGIAWQLHIYTIGVLFLILAIYTLCSLIRLGNRHNLITRGYFVTLNLVLLLLGTTRATLFLIDAYNSNGIFHSALAHILFNTAFPCLTSALSIEIFALLNTLKLKILPASSSKIQQTGILAAIIVSHFILSFTTDVVIGIYANTFVLIVICQVVFISWGLLLSSAYFYMFRKLIFAGKRQQKQIDHINMVQSHNPQYTNNKPKLTILFAIKMTLFTAICVVLLVVLQIYNLVNVFRVAINYGNVHPFSEAWSWWTYQLCMRIIELLVAFSIACVACQPITNNNLEPEGESTLKGYNCFIFSSTNGFYFPCHRFCWSGQLEREVESEELKCLDAYASPYPLTGQQNGFGNNQYKTFPIDTTPLNFGQSSDPCLIDSSFKLDSLPSNRGDSMKSHSMLVKENGYIRFRKEGDPLQEPLASSTDDDLDYKNSVGESSKIIKYPFGIHSLGRKHHSTDQALSHTSSEMNSKQIGNKTGIHDAIFGSNDLKRLNKFKRSISVPNTANNSTNNTTPVGFLTPKSLCSTDFDGVSAFSFKPPSSIHLHESIDKALQFMHINSSSRTTVSTSESQELSDNLSLPKTPNSLGASNPCFKYDNAAITHGGMGDSTKSSHNSLYGNKYKITSPQYNQCNQSKTVLLRQNLEQMRSRGASKTSLNGDTHYKSGLDRSKTELDQSGSKGMYRSSSSDVIII